MSIEIYGVLRRASKIYAKWCWAWPKHTPDVTYAAIVHSLERTHVGLFFATMHIMYKSVTYLGSIAIASALGSVNKIATCTSVCNL